ncbi:hypothetical protein [Kitasatospora sp. NPDC127060]|uniref:hypothetical protein n=1 Tax=Kitasatospora sp. NPDC127060 TaxID=3347121 RepID=UPI0036699F92
MTAAIPFSHSSPPALPGDVARAPRELMTRTGMPHDVERWCLVEIRLGGRWRPALLTAWRRPPASPDRIAHVRWAPDGPGPGEEPWAWLAYDKATIRRLPEPAAPIPPTNAVVVPPEMAGAPAPDDSGRCWRLAWIRTGDRWHCALLTEQRRPAPTMPWIVSAR